MTRHLDRVLLGSVLVAVGCGVAVAYDWRPVAAFPLLIIAVGTLRRPSGRMIAVLVGALLVFNSDAGINARKLGFLALLVLVSLISAWRVAQRTGPAISWLIAASSTMTITLLFSTFSGFMHGNDITAVLRDLITYFLLAFGPLIGADAGVSMSERDTRRIAVISGFVAAVGFAVYWLGQRKAGALGAHYLVLPSQTLIALGFAVAMACLLVAGQLRWLPPATLIPMGMIITGTRTGLVVLAAIPALFGSRAKARVNLTRGVLISSAAAIGFFYSLPLLMRSLGVDPAFLAQRVAAGTAVLGGASDGSLTERSRAYDTAWTTFQDSPLVGTGFGHLYPPVSGSGAALPGLDTPLLIFSKFGLIGAIGVLLAGLMLARSCSEIRKATGYSTTDTAARGFVAIFTAILPFGLPLEDKGTGPALMLLMSMFMARGSIEQTDGRQCDESQRLPESRLLTINTDVAARSKSHPETPRDRRRASADGELHPTSNCTWCGTRAEKVDSVNLRPSDRSDRAPV